jgi:hypothetical protein
MVDAKRNPNTAAQGRLGFLAKIAIAAAVVLTARMITAQAPAPALTGAPVEEDALGYKVQVPLASLTTGKDAKSQEPKFRTQMRQMLTQGQPSITDPVAKVQFDGFYLGYLIPKMTTEEGLKTISKERQDFLSSLATAKAPEARNRLLEIAVPALKRIVEDNYRPASRYNAMLILSSLNDQEPNNIGAQQTFPEPMRSLLPYILEQFRKPENPDVVKIPALLGLARHLECENYKIPPSASPLMPPAQRAEVIKELTALAETKEPPPGRNADGHLFLRRRAIEALGLACATKPDPNITATLEGLLKDDSDALSARFTVAATLGRMSLQPPAAINPVATAKELGYLALVGCDAELTREENYRKSGAEHEARLAGTYSGDIDYSGGGSGGGMMPGPGGIRSGMGEGGGLRPALRPLGAMPGGGEELSGGMSIDPSTMDPKHYRQEFLRRRIRQQLYAVQLGLTGGDDHPPPRAKGGGAAGGSGSGGSSASGSGSGSGGNTPPKDQRGVFAIAKAGAERDEVDKVYHKVRKLAEVIEAGADVEFHQLVKDMRKDIKDLEAILPKRLPPAGAAATGVAAGDDSLSAPGAGGKKAAAAKAGKTTAPKGTAPPPVKKGTAPGKSASHSPAGAVPVHSPARREPNVFGQPRTSR